MTPKQDKSTRISPFSVKPHARRRIYADSHTPPVGHDAPFAQPDLWREIAAVVGSSPLRERALLFAQLCRTYPINPPGWRIMGVAS